MEFSDLVTFATVARHGGITRAATELRTVQSNVTNRIKALEAEVGTALFERHSRGMALTGAGRRLLPYVERLTALSREAIVATRDDGVPKGPLAIGSMETTAAVRLPSLLASFHKACPAVELTLRTTDDGVRLFATAYVPKDASEKYPILMQRTPYSVAPYGADNYRVIVGQSHFENRSGRHEEFFIRRILGLGGCV